MESVKQHLKMYPEHDGNGKVPFSDDANDTIDFEVIDDSSEETTVTAEKIVKSLPADVTMIVQNPSYTLKTLETYRQLISEEMRVILQKEGHKSYNFRRYGEVLRKITTATRFKTDFIRDLFHRLVTTAPDSIAQTSYSTVVHYQKSLLDYQEILRERQRRLHKELETLKHVLTKVDETFNILCKRAQEISELLFSITAEEITSYPPQELEEFRAILESALDAKNIEVAHQTARHALIKVLEAIGIQALSVKEHRKYQEILSDIEHYLGQEKTAYVAAILKQFASLSPREIARKYDATLIKHHLFLLSHFTLLLEGQSHLHILEQYNETSKRISEALNIKLNPYKEQLGLRICDELIGIHSDELAAYQPYERIREYRRVLESSLAASESDKHDEEIIVRQKTLVKVLEAEGIQILSWEEPDKHKKYQEVLGHIEQNVLAFKEEFLKERLTRFTGVSAKDIAQKYRVNTIKHNVLLLARLSLLLNMQENVGLMFEYYTVSKNIFEALNLKLEEGKNYQEDKDSFRLEAKKVLLESDLFRTLSTGAIDRIVDRFVLQKFSQNTAIIQKGQKGDAFYVIKKGSVKVGIPSKGGKEIELAVLQESDCFGEMSLLTGNPASASITSIEEVQLLQLSEERFNDILLEYPVLNRYFHRILSERLKLNSVKTQNGDFHKGLVGKLSTISLEELIQTLYTANKTGILTIDNQNDKGKIFIKNGLVIHAMTKNLKGEQAFFRLMTWYDASFRFIPGEVNVERTVTMNVHGLLLEAMKRIDDMRQIKHL